MFIDIIFLPLLFFLGIIASYEDAYTGKIRNKWIFLGVAYGLGAFLCLLIWHFGGQSIGRFYYFQILGHPVDSPAMVVTVNLPFIYKSLANFLITVIVGFVMWQYNIWAAGDAKLYMVFSLLLPITFYWKSSMPLWPAFALLTNIFILILLYFIFRSAVHYIRREFQAFFSPDPDHKMNIKEIKEKFKSATNQARKNIGNIISIFMAMMAIMLLFKIIGSKMRFISQMNFGYMQTLVFASFTVFGRQVGEMMKKKSVFSLVGIFLFGSIIFLLVSDPYANLAMLGKILVTTTIFMVIFGIFQKFILFYVEQTGFQDIDINELAPRMSLKDKELARFNMPSGQEINPNSLSSEAVHIIKEQAQGMGLNKISVGKPFPFAIWMFGGVLLTILLKESILNIIINYIKNL